MEGSITNIHHLKQVYNETIDRTLIFPFRSWDDTVSLSPCLHASEESDKINKQLLGYHSMSEYDYRTSLALSSLKKLQQEIYNSSMETNNVWRALLR